MILLYIRIFSEILYFAFIQTSYILFAGLYIEINEEKFNNWKVQNFMILLLRSF